MAALLSVHAADEELGGPGGGAVDQRSGHKGDEEEGDQTGDQQGEMLHQGHQRDDEEEGHVIYQKLGDILNVSLLDHPGQQQGQQKQHTDHAGGKIEGKASGDDFGNKAQSEYDEDLTRENQRRSPRKKQNRVPVSGAHIVYPLIEQKSISVGIEDDNYFGVFCGKRGENPAEFR